MSEQIVRRAERIVDAQSSLPWLVAVGVYALLTAVGPKLLSGPDTYSHIALGRWMLEHGAVPTTDPFQPRCAEPIGLHSSGSRRSCLRWLTRPQVGPASSQ